MKMKELDKSIFEKIFDSKNGIYGKYKIIKDLGIINNRRMVRIKFITTGYETDIRYDYAVNEISVKDPYYPKSHGVACTGNVQNIKRKHKRVYDRWMSMISRCYNPNAKDYKRYGAIGVTVDPRWLCFENYLHGLMLSADSQFLAYRHLCSSENHLQQVQLRAFTDLENHPVPAILL